MSPGERHRRNKFESMLLRRRKEGHQVLHPTLHKVRDG